MSVNWEELEINSAELEELMSFNLLSTWALDFSRVFCLRNRAYVSSLLFTEGCGLFLAYLLFFPILLILFRNLGWLNNNFNGLLLVLLSTASLSLVLVLLLNFYLWHQAKQLKVFAILLEKVKQYNGLIAHLKLFAELDSLSSVTQINHNSPGEIELKAALELTKNSLLKSIELEKILNRDRHLANNRYQLLANLESSLINLESFSQDEANNYQQLLAEVIEIGLSVHKEVRKMRILRE
ncbi:MAG: hypothetical protein RLZZ574_1185 [Cyanobacteriota bacterium]